jgi:hypothetical protein
VSQRAPLIEGNSGQVVVFGGHGFYGRYLVQDLLAQTGCSIVVAGRRPVLHGWPRDRVQARRCDVRDAEAVRQVVATADLVAHCAGPFQSLPLEPARAAARLGKPYIDISEDRQFHREVSTLEAEAEGSGSLMMPGLSVVPGMVLMFTELATQRLEQISSVHTYAAPDTRRHRGAAMFHAMLRGVGRPYLTRRAGSAITVYGWTEAEWMTFPSPIGRRLTFLVLEMADVDVVREFFQAESDFKAGCEWQWINRALNLCAVTRSRFGHPQLERWTPIIRAVSWMIGRFGNEAGGVVFAFHGTRGGTDTELAYAVTSPRHGARIPAMLAGIGAQRILNGAMGRTGVVRRQDWLTGLELADALKARGLALWRRGAATERWCRVEGL